jgi:uncharacterized membrane protein
VKFDFDVVIDRPVDDVFAYVTDVRNLPEWQESAVEAAWIEVSSPRLGARLRERRDLFGRTIESEVEVTAYEPGRRFDLRALSGPIRFVVRHRFEAVENGTRLRLGAEGEPGGMLRFAGPVIARQAQRQFRDDLQRLKQVLESEH